MWSKSCSCNRQMISSYIHKWLYRFWLSSYGSVWNLFSALRTSLTDLETFTHCGPFLGNWMNSCKHTQQCNFNVYLRVSDTLNCPSHWFSLCWRPWPCQCAALTSTHGYIRARPVLWGEDGGVWGVHTSRERAHARTHSHTHTADCSWGVTLWSSIRISFPASLCPFIHSLTIFVLFSTFLFLCLTSDQFSLFHTIKFLRTIVRGKFYASLRGYSGQAPEHGALHGPRSSPVVVRPLLRHPL